MITVYSKDDCQQCIATKTKLDKLGAEYEVIDTPNTPGAPEAVRELGYRALPVIVFGELNWAGYSPDKLKAAADAQQRIAA